MTLLLLLLSDRGLFVHSHDECRLLSAMIILYHEKLCAPRCLQHAHRTRYFIISDLFVPLLPVIRWELFRFRKPL